MTTAIEKFLKKTNDSTMIDLAWLLEHGFELAEEQIHSYSASIFLNINGKCMHITAEWHFKGSYWNITARYTDKNVVTFFKFKNGFIYVNDSSVQDALEKALADLEENA